MNLLLTEYDKIEIEVGGESIDISLKFGEIDTADIEQAIKTLDKVVKFSKAVEAAKKELKGKPSPKKRASRKPKQPKLALEETDNKDDQSTTVEPCEGVPDNQVSDVDQKQNKVVGSFDPDTTNASSSWTGYQAPTIPVVK